MPKKRSLKTVLEGANTLDRRQFLQRTAILGISLPFFGSLLAACEAEDDDVVEDDTVDPVGEPDDDDNDVEPAEDDDVVEEPDDEDVEPAEDDAEGTYGGTLRYALSGEPPSLDSFQTTQSTVQLIMGQVFEPLFTWDDDFELIPDLAEELDVSEDGLLNTITLRQGVLFHDGEELTAEDAIASVERYFEVAGPGATDLQAATEEIRAVDDYTIEFEMSAPFGAIGSVLGLQNGCCFIYPKWVIDEVGTSDLSETGNYIGTGPYRFVEHQPDSHILMERFEDYVYRDEPSDGYGGRKYGYVDEIRFIPVPDESARVSGLQAGDYDFAATLTPEQYDVFEGDDRVEVFLADPAGDLAPVLNLREGPLTDITLRRAIQAALDMEEILIAATGEGFYRLNPSPMMEETAWHTEAGAELYNQANPELAQEYLEEAGYDGELIRILASTENQPQYNVGVMVNQQLQQIGMNTELLVFDTATKIEVREDPSEWEIEVTGFSARTEPNQLSHLNCEWIGGYCTEGKDELLRQLMAETDFDVRFEVWEELQELIYEEVPIVKVGDQLTVRAYNPRVQNVSLLGRTYPMAYNVWLEG